MVSQNVSKNSVEGYGSRLQERIVARLNDPSYIPFRLYDSFTQRYSNVKPPFGFNGLGELVYMRTYSRIKDDGFNEKWPETITRVVNGTYNMQKRWILERGLPWDDSKAQDSAQEMYDRMFNMKFLPPGRGLWAMGSSITEERGLYAALNNCAFVSTENIKDDLAKPFTFLMDASMLGVGVGFDTRGEGKILIKSPKIWRAKEIYEIPDSREGWVESANILLESYFHGTQEVEFKYDQIRPEGQLLKGFGGYSSGPEPLIKAHEHIREILSNNSGRPITAKTIVDIQNIIGKCVVMGNIRRTAEIAFGDPYSEEFLDLKNYVINPDREGHGWASNNSVFADIGMDYKKISERIKLNGEPGIAWLDNMQKYGRMKDGINNKDSKAMGGNPCLEQTLESYELCNVVENFPNNHTDKKDFLRTLKFSYLYGKTVTLGETLWPETNRVILRNRRIGNSVTGVAQFVRDHNVGELVEWLNDGYSIIQKYDNVYSDWLTTQFSKKTTSVKPSGSVSLVAGATSGMHWPESEYYIRRIWFGKNSSLLEPLRNAGYKIEPAAQKGDSSMVVSIPVHVGSGLRNLKDVSMWEQLSLASLLQEHWADNQVSCTVTFDPEKEGGQIADALNYFQYKLKGISLLPRTKEGAYEQMPFEEITESKYGEELSKLKSVDFSMVRNNDAVVEKFCNNDTCEIPSIKKEILEKELV